MTSHARANAGWTGKSRSVSDHLRLSVEFRPTGYKTGHRGRFKSGSNDNDGTPSTWYQPEGDSSRRTANNRVSRESSGDRSTRAAAPIASPRV